jgi:DNA-binding MarR family transcriptional regulator
VAEPPDSPMGAFLETLQKKKATLPATGTAPSPLSLLALLAAGPRPVSELQKESGMEFSDFAAALKSLVDGGFVTLTGPPSEETATLTESGAGLVTTRP